MDNLEHLSDDELRRRLLQFGFPNMPVTSSTRKILIKKLRNYMEAERSKLRRETTHATRYSSDEEQSDQASASSSTTTSSSRPVRLGRSAAARATIAGTTAPPTAIPEPASGGGGRSQFLRPSTAKYQNHQAQPTSVGGQSAASRMSLQLSRPTLMSTSPLPAAQLAAGGGGGSRMSLSRSPTVYVSPVLQGSSGDEDTDEDAPDFGPTHSSTTTHSSAMNGQSSAAGESQYMADFKQRLLSLRGVTIAKDSQGRLRQSGPPPALSSPFKRPRTPRQFSNTNNNNNHYADTSLISNSSDLSAINNSNSSSNAGRPNAFAASFAAVCQRLGNLCAIGKHSSMVPCILHTLLLAFFVLVAVAYLAINPNLANTIQAADTKHTLCTADLHAIGVPCIERADLEPTLAMIRRTAVELQRRAVERRCGGGGGGTHHPPSESAQLPPHMSAKEVVHVVLEASAGYASVQSIRAALLDMEYLLHSNRQWGIRRCDAAGTATEWSPDDQQPSTHYIIPNPTLSLRCKFYTKMQTFYTLVGTVALACAVGWAAYALYEYVRRWRRSRKEAVDFFIAGIIQALMEKASAVETADEALLVINHLRDQLIRPAQRTAMAWAWSEAIRFLEANESRIHFEVGTHNGEDCQMMRWAAEQSTYRTRSSAAAAASAAATPAIKKWQSPAFDKLNKIRDPPTPCLKIRHMFEPHEPVTNALRLGIQDAILEKVHNTGCRIYDVQLDAQSCCVYVRCATATDAGIVHEQINGWWFDSRLVSIKFLHLERYVSRFPKGQTGPKCMQPSNAKMLSMSGCSGPSGQNGCSAEVDDADEY